MTSFLIALSIFLPRLGVGEEQDFSLLLASSKFTSAIGTRDPQLEVDLETSESRLGLGAGGGGGLKVGRLLCSSCLSNT